MSLSQPLIGVDHQSCLFINPLVDVTSIPPSYHFVIITSGSRGDVQPYIALGLLLRSKGNDVTIATEKRMEDIVKEFGLDYFPLEGDPTGLLFEQSAKKALQEGSMMKLIKLTEEWDKKFSKVDIFNSIYRACFGDIDHGTRRRADAIIASPLTMTPSYCVAEKLNIPWIPVILGPTMPTNEFPIWPLEKMIPCSCLNRWSYNLAFKMLWNSESKVINPWRQNLDLEPWTDTPRGIADILDRVRPPILIASSKLLCGPRGEVPTDYPINCHVVGFYYVPSSNPGDINADILSFFSHHSESIPGKIVYLGFGSMPSDNPVNLVKLALEITTTCNCRAVLVAGWSELNSTECIHIMQPAIEEKKLLVLKSIPHDWVLPRVDCIVHHCGVGTMAAALRAGKPQIPCPVMLDQPHNADIVIRLKCAIQSIPFQHIYKKKKILFSVISRTLDNENNILEKAMGVSQVIAQESASSLENSIDIICKHVQIYRSAEST